MTKRDGLTANEYQELATRTLIKIIDNPLSIQDQQDTYAVLEKTIKHGLALEVIKKAIFHGHTNLRSEITSWFERLNICRPCGRSGISVSEDEYFLVWNLVGLMGEVAEFGQMLFLRLTHVWFPTKEEYKKELGDILWYVAMLCRRLDLDLGDVMQANIDKLRERYPKGFSTSASISRVDVAPDIEEAFDDQS